MGKADDEFEEEVQNHIRHLEEMDRWKRARDEARYRREKEWYAKNGCWLLLLVLSPFILFLMALWIANS